MEPVALEETDPPLLLEQSIDDHDQQTRELVIATIILIIEKLSFAFQCCIKHKKFANNHNLFLTPLSY